MVALAWPVAAHTTESDPYVERVLGRADADASGGWWVALWVIDGDRSHFVVSAPRSELGDLPDARWTPVDAQALMSLEYFGAPRLLAMSDVSACPVTLRWGQALPPPPNGHWSGERIELQHSSCLTGSCSQRQAWRIELPPGHAKTLPLAQLLPGLAMKEPQWLALHVASAATSPHLSGLRELVVPPEWPLAVNGPSTNRCRSPQPSTFPSSTRPCCCSKPRRSKSVRHRRCCTSAPQAPLAITATFASGEPAKRSGHGWG
ncbi:MAG: hypothetical protein J0L58_16545 [Burkholderiales bacterium]|nr:hypothetical protein [Burkholderiales bacterium]